MAHLDKERLLIPEQLAQLSPTNVLLVDVGDPQRYAQAHIPDAVHVSPRELMTGTPPAPGRLPDTRQLSELFSRLGLTPDTLVVAYDDEGGGWAGRFIWTLEVIGHSHWAYLDGGLHAWQASGQPLSNKPVEPVRREQTVTLHDTVIASAEDILAHLQADDDSMLIWDARSPEEYRGEKVVAQRGGHIPGAINVDWLELMDRQRDLRLREDLAEYLAARGITADKSIVTHCQTHHRSGLTWLAARLLGLPRPKAYPGSWSEWASREDTPVQQGDTP